MFEDKFDSEKNIEDDPLYGEFFAHAEGFYKLLSSVYFLELTEEQIEGLAESGFVYPEDGSDMASGCKKVRTYLKRRGPNARQDLAVDYARIFLAAGVYDGETAVPYESVYTSSEGLLMQESRDEVVRVYADNGLWIPLDRNIPEDHLAFELEFMAHLSRRIADVFEGNGGGSTDEVLDLAKTQLAFIDEHLLNWIPLLQERVANYAKLPFYPAVLVVTKNFVEETRAALLEMIGI